MDEMTNTEQLRRSFQPERIRTLFVGESEPAGPAFFYLDRGLVFSQFRRVLQPVVGDSPDFLTAFCRAGINLDDLVLKPINDRTKAERRQLRVESIPELAGRLAEYQPESIVCFMKAVAPSVAEAINQAGLASPFFSVPFPGNGQQG